jgi:hypothetical protein
MKHLLLRLRGDLPILISEELGLSLYTKSQEELHVALGKQLVHVALGKQLVHVALADLV